MKQSLEVKLLNYLDANKGWHKKVAMYVLGDALGYSPETVGRALRRLANENKVQVEYYDGMFARHLAKYASNGTERAKVLQPKIEMREGKYVAVY